MINSHSNAAGSRNVDAVVPPSTRQYTEIYSNGPAKGMVLDDNKQFTDFIGEPASEGKREMPLQARGPLADTSDELAARDIVQDYITQVINSRDSEQALQARLDWTWKDTLLAILLRRDDAADELVRRDNGQEQHMQSRSVLPAILARLLKLIGFRIQLRDVTPEELARRYNLDDFINNYLPKTRDLGTQPENQARSLLDGLSETVARDDSAGDFLNALLKNRDSPNFPRDLLSLASLASRVFDD